MAPIVKKFDYLVIGGGSGGLGSARRAAEHGANAAVIEHGRWGGTCVSLFNDLDLIFKFKIQVILFKVTNFKI